MNQPTLLFIQEHLQDDVRALALKKAPAEVNLGWALQQIAARQTLKRKLPEWAANLQLYFPVHLSLEQASGQATAIYKSHLVKGNTLVDLTGGMGVDCFYLSKQFSRTTYVEQQEELCRLAEHNYQVLQAPINVVNSQAESYVEQMQPVDCIYIDPARRDNVGRKTVSIADCTPDLTQLQNLLRRKTEHILIKLSPMLDLSLALNDLQHIEQVHIVSVDNECKELLFLMTPGYKEEPQIICVNIVHQTQIQQSTPMLRSKEQELNINYTSTLGRYLYEPNSSILKGGFFKTTAIRFQIEKLNASSHLYTANEWIPQFEGRAFEIMEVIPFSKKAIKELSKRFKSANITIRNFPISVNELRKQLKMADGGQTYIFATTLANQEYVLILCRKPQDTSSQKTL